jgi:hypothetical protein
MSKYSSTATSQNEQKAYVSPRIPAASVTDVELGKAEFFKSKENQTPGINLIWVAIEPTEGLEIEKHPVDSSMKDRQYASQGFWLTEAAMDENKAGSLPKFLNILAERLGGEKGLSEWLAIAATVESDEDYAEKIEKHFVGKPFAGLFIGVKKSYNDKEGVLRTSTDSFLNFWGTFARPIKERAELEAELTKLGAKAISDKTAPAKSQETTDSGDDGGSEW